MTAIALWTHLHRESVDDARAINAVRSSCRSSAGGTLAVAGSLGVIALLLVIANAIAVRRRPSATPSS